MYNDNNEHNDYDGTEENEKIDDFKRKNIIRTIALITALFFVFMIVTPLAENLNLPSLKFLNESFKLTQSSEVKEFQRAIATINVGAKKGTGFNIKDEGLIVTNAHVVENEKNVTVRFYKGKSFTGEVWQLYNDLDIALIKMDAKDLPKLEIEQNFKSKNGDEVLIIGNPLEYEGIANKGIIQGMARVSGIDVPVLLIEAPINRGHSGSPVINVDGKVIGIVFATVNNEDYRDSIMGVAIPIEYLQNKKANW